ncbi:MULTISPECIES: cytochrome b5-like heme/steroid binding domain-containing protein [Rhodopseudomonas]|uniref:Cytochrome B5 n=1 Tax=Rhodopseudomonas palustris TaxID=1076 RepID=A0A0D7EHY0_RHOPL|nr:MULTISPECIES: cytochrome b5-like heme/steroid binding domain-containing protein [Rhodopseudomonas]KIZ40251.1 cytochrome B5 [Rhodopseudomonas palustris]MDF3811311.1 cytochrome b5-like heme/steroid binding domain-containing protein [Rhodopseudomonas sp. BAL398]WOK18636.1 cytochrome b5-like heme/steroid binding domain-containing protein [Rhodopseudomonas sp. BAL398]
MMRKLYLATTSLFWVMVLAFWAGDVLSPHAEQPAAISASRDITSAELAKHATPQDCWMAIRGQVYDLSAYLPDHPSRPQIIEPWCGKEATQAYDTKTKGRPHSKEADDLLPKYRVGRFVPGAD